MTTNGPESFFIIHGDTEINRIKSLSIKITSPFILGMLIGICVPSMTSIVFGILPMVLNPFSNDSNSSSTGNLLILLKY